MSQFIGDGSAVEVSETPTTIRRKIIEKKKKKTFKRRQPLLLLFRGAKKLSIIMVENLLCYLKIKNKNSGAFHTPPPESCLAGSHEKEILPPHTKEVNRASIGDKSHPALSSSLFFYFLFGTGRSLARKFSDGNGRIYIQAKYKRTGRGGGDALYGGGERQDLEEKRKWWGLFSSVSDFSLSTSVEGRDGQFEKKILTNFPSKSIRSSRFTCC